MLTETRAMVRDATIQATSAEKILRAAAENGVSPRLLCDRVHLDPNRLKLPDQRILFAQIVSLYEEAARLTKDDAFGLHMGERVDPNAFDVLGYSVMNSANLGEAFNRILRYHYIWTNGAAFEMARTKPTTTITYKYLDLSVKQRRHDAEMTLAAVVSLGRKVTGRHWVPLSVSFEHGEPTDISEHRRIFGCEVKFAVETNALVFSSDTLSFAINKADPALCALLDRHAEELLTRFPAELSLTNQVSSTINQELRRGGDATLERVAARLGMSSRTLQRKLKQSGTSHQKLVDQARKELALRFLREGDMEIAKVAYLLGFSESSALHRAFKRWTGTTPREFRRR
jgi:AraC-like DNA-binding protein